MKDQLCNYSVDELKEKIKAIEIDLKSLKESSTSEFVNDGILNQVKDRIRELENKKIELEKLL